MLIKHLRNGFFINSNTKCFAKFTNCHLSQRLVELTLLFFSMMLKSMSFPPTVPEARPQTWGKIFFCSHLSFTAAHSLKLKVYQNISILRSGQLFWQSNYNWVVDCRNTPVEDLIRSQLKSEKEFTVQHSSHFKMCIAVNFKSLQKKTAPSFDLLFDTVSYN